MHAAALQKLVPSILKLKIILLLPSSHSLPVSTTSPQQLHSLVSEFSTPYFLVLFF